MLSIHPNVYILKSVYLDMNEHWNWMLLSTVEDNFIAIWQLK